MKRALVDQFSLSDSGRAALIASEGISLRSFCLTLPIHN